MKSDEQFSEQWTQAQAKAFRVAGWLARRGHRIRIVPALLRPDVSRWSEYSDHGDLEITHRIEVKSRSFDFYSVEDFSRRFKEVIVDETRNLERRDSERASLLGHIILNASATGYLYVPCRTSKYWRRDRLFYNVEQGHREVYLCPLEHATYVAMGER